MKKLLSTILCLVCTAVLLVSAAACDGILMPAKAEDLVQDMDLSQLASGFTLDMESVVNDKTGEKVHLAGSIADGKVNGDFIDVKSLTLGIGKNVRCEAAFVRDNQVYTTAGRFPGEMENDCLTTAAALLEDSKTLSCLGGLDALLDQISDADIDWDALLAASTVTQQQAEQVSKALEQLSKNLLKVVFNKAFIVEKQYVVSADFEEAANLVWTGLYAVAKVIDGDASLTISGLYGNLAFKLVATTLLKDITGAQIEALLSVVKQGVEASGVEFPVKVLASKENETAYDYVGRLIESYKVQGKITLGSMLVSDVLELIFQSDEPVKLVPYMDQNKQAVFDEAKNLNENVSLELTFSSQKQFVKAYVCVIVRGERLEEKTDFVLQVCPAPQLVDISKITIVDEE